MVSLTSVPSINKGDLARQSLLLRPVLASLFAVVAIWVSGAQQPIVLAIIAYAASSALLAAGYRTRLLGSTDVVYVGMVDTSLLLGAGILFTGGAVSPILFLFFGFQATYFVLATPRTFIIAAVLSVAIMITSVVLVNSELVLMGVDPTLQPLAYLVAAAGSLAMLSSVGWIHSLWYVARSQAQQHLTVALGALGRLVSSNREEKPLTSILGPLMTTLNITDEGVIYRFDQASGTLLLEDRIGLRPWFQKFPVFWPEEGVVGQAYRLKKRVIYQDPDNLRQCYGNLSQRNLEILEEVAQKSDPPQYAIAVPLSWGEEVLGVLVLTRQQGSLDEREVELVEGFAAHMATAMRESDLDGQLASLTREIELHHRFQSLLQSAGDPENGFREFAQRLSDLLAYDAISIYLETAEGLEPNQGYFWSAEDLVLDQASVEVQSRAILGGALPASVFLGSTRPGTLVNSESFTRWEVPPELAQQGIGSIAGFITQGLHPSGAQPPGVLLLLHRQPTAYGLEHLPLLEELQPIFTQLGNLVATSGRWQMKSHQINSLQNIMSLTHASGDEDQVIKNLVQGVAEQLSGPSLVPVSAILSDENRGTVTITEWAPDAKDGFRLKPAGNNSGSLKELFQQWQASGPQVLPVDAPLGQVLTRLLQTPDPAQYACFPLGTSEMTMGVLAISLVPSQRLTPEQMDSIQQLSDVASLCLSITRQHEAQARQTRELQHEDELRRSFLSYITHEFRTPLASLKTSFELIQESEKIRNLEDPYQRLLVNVNRSVATLEQLTNDLSEVANISAGGVILNKSLASPESIVYPVLESTAPLSHLKNQSLEIEVMPGLPQMLADTHRLEQVLTNMVSNAIKYTPPGGTIRTIVSQDNGSIKFMVSDTGRGIPQEDLEKVFEPFYRVPQQAQDRTPGTGLGLALAKSLVELHGGEIWVESESEKGSTFCFTIPAELRNYETVNH